MSQKKHADDQVFETFETVGGSAFPSEWGAPSGGKIACPGMTLRDWFAGQALAGMLAWAGDEASGAWNTNATSGDIARMAYRQADAMLAARSKGES